MLRKEVKEYIIKTFLEQLDSKLEGYSFKRPKKGIKYTRKTSDIRGCLCFDFAYHPPYSRGDLAHIQPRVMIYSKVLYAKSLELVNGNHLLLGGAEDLLINMPIEFCAPKTIIFLVLLIYREVLHQKLGYCPNSSNVDSLSL